VGGFWSLGAWRAVFLKPETETDRPFSTQKNRPKPTDIFLLETKTNQNRKDSDLAVTAVLGIIFILFFRNNHCLKSGIQFQTTTCSAFQPARKYNTHQSPSSRDALPDTAAVELAPVLHHRRIIYRTDCLVSHVEILVLLSLLMKFIGLVFSAKIVNH
jgi:hypothetical protein